MALFIVSSIVRSEEAKSLQRPFAAGMHKALRGAGSAASEPQGRVYGVSLEELRLYGQRYDIMLLY